MRTFIVVVLLLLNGCADKPDNGQDGKSGSCSVQTAVNGVVITCTDGTSAVVTNGQHGNNGQDGRDGLDGRDGIDAIVEFIDPCGDNPGHFDEVVLKLSTGELLAYFESGSHRFLSLIRNGNYRTTDVQNCAFSVNNGVVTW